MADESSWLENPFWADLVARLDKAEATVQTVDLRYDEEAAAWSQNVQPDRACMPVLLQGRRLVVDVTDRQLALYPLGLSGRYHLGIDLAGRYSRRLLTRPGSAVLEGGDGWTVTTRVSPTAPLVEIKLSAFEGPTHLRWTPGEWSPRPGGAWLLPASFEQDPVIERNNSTIPDPFPSPDLACSGVLVQVLGATSHASAVRDGVLELAGGDGELTVVLVAAENEARAEEWLDAWLPARADEVDYWDDIGRRLALRVPDAEIERQARFSTHNSLFSRSVTDGGREIFVHGRRDRGYADAAHLHQSYQLHLPALAAGESAGVRDELLAFTALQRADGWLEAAPRPGQGWSRYVGRYTNAHLLLATHRYLSWTGDRAILDEPVVSEFDPVPRSFGERVELAAEDLLATRVRGLLAPCGWADAWNPDVRAQGQITACGHLALTAYAEVSGIARYREAADGLAAALRTTLYDGTTGIVAEHLFDDGPAGGTPDDFWAHTQIWVSLAGLVPDRRGLDLVRDRCLDLGLAVTPPSAFANEYLVASTDSVDSLPVASTATWLLARWPELTHLYALAEIEAGDPDAALTAVRSQLPELLHRLAPACAPYYYAEKYLHPGTRPWLCTWAGDPSLIEVVLSGFCGVRPDLEGLRIRPSLPSEWRGRPFEVHFVWRGASYLLRFEPGLPSDTMWVDDFAQAAAERIPFAPGSHLILAGS